MRIERPDLADLDWPVPASDAPTRPADTADRSRATSGAFFAKREASSQPLGIIGCSENASPSQRRQARFPARRAAILLGAGGLGLLLHSSAGRIPASDAGQANPASPLTATTGAPAINLPPPDMLRPLTADEAAQQNAARPFVDRADTPASRFVLRTDAEDRDRATNCLAQAVYYEAAGEGIDGGRAVAQVVLNRVRHPGYPASVCGVVYQGAERLSGCQFTFACDGSLQRIPIPALWVRSREIAEEALAGRVYALVGHATHYHADYVLPYWADSLDKTVQIAQHIFYRLRGSLGDGGSFFQRYAGTEPQIALLAATIVVPPTDAAQLASALMSDNVNGTTPEVERAAPPASPLLVDASRGALIADEQAPALTTRKTKSSSDCGVAGDRKQLAPLGANDMRSAVAPSGC